MQISSLRTLAVHAIALALPTIAALTYGSSAAADDHGPTAATVRAYARLLDRFDANHDGILQTSELSGPALQRLAAADANRDGVITREELHAHGVAERATRFARADKNGDGKLEPSEVSAPRWSFLKAADADHDGAVTLDEIERAIAAGTLQRETEPASE